MATIILFVPRMDVEAARNVTEFVKMCREELTVFGADLDFAANKWDVSEEIELKGKSGKRYIMQFSDYDASKQTKGNWKPMAEPFLSFAKSYMRYQHAMKPSKSIGNRLAALRALERALSENGYSPAIENADAAAFTRAAALIDKKLVASAYHVAKDLELLAAFCSDNLLTRKPIQWRSHLKRPQDRNRIGAEAERRRIEKLPSEAALEALPKAFWLARETPDVIITSAAALLCCSPDRISELLSLPVDCEVEQEFEGKVVYGLRWWPAKGADPMIKWIAPSMVDVAKEAIRRLREHTDEARRIAKWYEQNVGQVYLPEPMKHLRGCEYVTFDDIAVIVGVTRNTVSAWLNTYGVPYTVDHSRNNQSSCRFTDFEKAVVDHLPKGFPFLVRENGLHYSDALFIMRLNEMHQQRCSINCLIEPMSIGQINDGLGASLAHNKSSVFSRLGFTEPDGSPIRITTHQFRHWLNTLAQRGGMSQLDIAKWSGRKDIRQNQDYDHMTAGELVQRLRQIAGDDVNIAGLPIEIRNKPPMAREEFLRMLIPAAHTTELGFCVHDWTFLPCQLHRDCVMCSEHCYIKGDLERMLRIREILAADEQQLALAEKAMAEECAGADRWTEHQYAKVARLRNLVEILDDPACPNGTLVRLAMPEVPSQIRFAMEDRQKLDGGSRRALLGE